jgi:putative FmdB family regulatory protein
MPLYEYGCRDCGTAFERMRRMEERLAAPECAACGSPRTALRLSAPGRVGAASRAAAGGAAGDAPGCALPDASACCGGGCAMPGLN